MWQILCSMFHMHDLKEWEYNGIVTCLVFTTVFKASSATNDLCDLGKFTSLCPSFVRSQKKIINVPTSLRGFED